MKLFTAFRFPGSVGTAFVRALAGNLAGTKMFVLVASSLLPQWASAITPSADNFEEMIGKSLPTDWDKALPVTIRKIFDNAKETNVLEQIRSLPQLHWSKNFIDIKTVVQDEHGKPLEGASLLLEEIRTLSASKELPFHRSRDHKVYVRKWRTEKDGVFLINDVHRFPNEFLWRDLYFTGKLRKPNLRLTVELAGYKTKIKEFLNVDGFAVALAVNYTRLMLAQKEAQSSPTEKPMPIAKELKIPAENLGVPITIKVVLKKEGNKSATDDEEVAEKISTEILSIFPEEIINSLPKNHYLEIPPNVLKAYSGAVAEELFHDESKKTIENSKNLKIISEHLKTFDNSVLVEAIVTDEAGKPIPDAFVLLEQIKSFYDFREIWEAYGDNYIPYAAKGRTKPDGTCQFDSIDMFNPLELAFHLYFKEQIRGGKSVPSLHLTVTAPGYFQKQVESFNINRKAIVLAPYQLALFLGKNWNEHRKEMVKPFPPFAKGLALPEENTKDVIRIKVMLQKPGKGYIPPNHKKLVNDFEKISKNVLPENLDEALSEELQKAFKEAIEKQSSDMPGVYDSFGPLWDVDRTGRVKVKVLVVDEQGVPVDDALLTLREIRMLKQSDELPAGGPPYYRTYKRDEKTDKTGSASFGDMDRMGYSSLYYNLCFLGGLGKPTLRLTVRHPKYGTVEKDFSNVDKTALALAVNYARVVLVEKEKECYMEMKKLPEIATKFVIPPENMEEVIAISVVLNRQNKP